jgi:uncharacterized protein YjbI with pentapeptide repeats
MQVFRPLQISFNSQVLEQNRKFYFIVSATLGVDLQTGEELLDLNYLKDIFECMGENPLPDTGMPKPNGEFLVSGSYYSPNKESVTGGEVKVRLGEIEKSLYIFGKREWKNGFPSKPELIDSMNLDWVNSFGGDGFKNNPDGKGYKDGKLPSIENPKHIVSSPSDFPEPAGFSQLSPMFPQRAKYQGTYDDNYLKNYFPGYPEDLDWKLFLCAPQDQWIKGYFQGDEKFSLYNMHPEIPVIKGTFPGLHPRCFVNRDRNGEEQFQELSLNLDTIWFFPEKLLSLLTYRGVMGVSGDEAEEITHVLCAYEDREKESHPLDYYKKTFERRKHSKDDLLKNMNTQDLIPNGHMCAMEILMKAALSGDGESELTKNIDTKTESMEKIADEKIEEAIAEAEKSSKKVGLSAEEKKNLPDNVKESMDKDGNLDIRKLTDKKPDKPDPDVEKFNEKVETILPGLLSGDPKKLDMKNFSFDKIDKITDAVKELSDKKEKDAKDVAKKEIEKSRDDFKMQIEGLEKQIKQAMISGESGQLKSLEKAKNDLLKSLKSIDDIDIDGTKKIKSPLPRLDIESIKAQTAQIDPKISEATQYVQSMRAMGIEDEKTKEIEVKLKEMAEEASKQIEEGLKGALEGFKEGYFMGAHFMDEGVSPHKESLEEVKESFIRAFSNNEDLSDKDWACIDLSGEKLDGINLSGAFLEQVNFKGASLVGANLSGAILARANLEEADFTNASFEEANVGAVHARKANFTGANFKSSKLSKGDFTDANFSNARIEEVESLEIVISGADFSDADMPGMIFLEQSISGAKFTGANMDTSIFLQCKINSCDFSRGLLQKSAFVDVHFRNVSFEKADISSGCFVGTEPEKSTIENMNFEGAQLKQTNFQGMDLKDTSFTGANLENAYFGGADLTNADLSKTYAKNAQFRKAKLTGANLDNINLHQGSLAKAHLVNASFKGANLYGVDFLRSTITNTDFCDSNLDTTLIEDWRPK